MEPEQTPAYGLAESASHQIQKPTGVGVPPKAPKPVPLKTTCSEAAAAAPDTPSAAASTERNSPAVNAMRDIRHLLDAIGIESGQQSPARPYAHLKIRPRPVRGFAAGDMFGDRRWARTPPIRPRRRPAP